MPGDSGPPWRRWPWAKRLGAGRARAVWRLELLRTNSDAWRAPVRATLNPPATYVVDFAYLLREEGQPMRSIYDRHVHGLFALATWLRLLEEAGFHQLAVRPLEHPDVPPGSVHVFVASRPAA